MVLCAFWFAKPFRERLLLLEAPLSRPKGNMEPCGGWLTLERLEILWSMREGIVETSTFWLLKLLLDRLLPRLFVLLLAFQAASHSWVLLLPDIFEYIFLGIVMLKTKSRTVRFDFI